MLLIYLGNTCIVRKVCFFQSSSWVEDIPGAPVLSPSCTYHGLWAETLLCNCCHPLLVVMDGMSLGLFSFFFFDFTTFPYFSSLALKPIVTSVKLPFLVCCFVYEEGFQSDGSESVWCWRNYGIDFVYWLNLCYIGCFCFPRVLCSCYCGSQTVCHGRIRFETKEQKCVIQFEVAQHVFSKQDLFYSVHVIEIYVSVYCSWDKFFTVLLDLWWGLHNVISFCLFYFCAR